MTRTTLLRAVKGTTLSLALLAAALPAGAKIRYLTLTEKTRQADFIFTATVKTLGSDYVTVKVVKVFKGSAPLNDIQVAWDKEENVEKHAAKHKVGDEILIFANKTGARYDPIAGSQGTLRLDQPGWQEQFGSAIQAISNYDATVSTEQKRTLLSSMLKGDNKLLQDAALGDMILRNPDARKSGLVTNDLTPDIVKLAKGSDRDVAIRATEVLAKFGGKETIPDLIDLVGSPHGSVSEVASRALSQKTGVQKEVQWRQPAADREKVKQEWQDWWLKNKDTARLRQ